jgi:hypothetical protein
LPQAFLSVLFVCFVGSIPYNIRVISVIRGYDFGCGEGALGNRRLNFTLSAI